MFKVGDIVKYTEEFSTPGEQYYIHVVEESFADSDKVLISTLNTSSPFGSSEWVTENMIKTAEKYEVIVYPVQALANKYFITDTKAKKCFAGCDSTGSISWVDSIKDAYAMTLEEAESTITKLF